MLPPWRLARSRMARAVRDGASPEQVAELRRIYLAARAKQYLDDLMSSDFPPNDVQCRELASMLAGGEADGAAAA